VRRGEQRVSPEGGGSAPRLALASLLAVTALVYARVWSHGFVSFDDSEYVYENAVVLRGLTWDGVTWAFGGFRFSNWQPVTWLSHMADVELFGVSPGPQHVVSVLLHLANTALLFALLRSTTGARWRSLAVAALFALHPLRVEPVAWISSRKDVLSTLFLLLALHAWAAYARGRRPGAFAAALGLSALGLMTKPMLVTVPLLLLLMDGWPLGRFGREGVRRLVLEKVPFALAALATGVLTVLAQSSGGGASAISPIPIWPRLLNAIASYGRYLEKTAWPTGLASFYPHPATVSREVPIGPAVVGALLVAFATALALRERARRPYLTFGWLWYAVTLAPVAGFLQVGGQAMADRYAYVPLVGVFVAAVWGVAELAERLRAPRWATAAGLGAILSALAASSWVQLGHWRDTFALHRRSLAVTERNWKAWHGLCGAELERGRLPEAVGACRAAVEALPTFPEGWQTLGVAHARGGQTAEAIACFLRALALRPDYFRALRNLGSAYANMGEFAEATAYFRRALEVSPRDPEVLRYLVLAAWSAGDRAAALGALEALRALDAGAAAEVAQRIGL
jgi:tetratricopeptide (TPR) repeat protein